MRELLEDKKAEDAVILDVQGLSTVTDYFIICTATSERHAKTLCEHVVSSLKGENIRPYHLGGLPEGCWVVMDYIDFIVHIFIHEIRGIYALEKLWGDAKRID